MQKSILASAILISLTACDADNKLVTTDSTVTTEVETTTVTTEGATTDTTTVTTETTTGGDTTAEDTTTEGTIIVVTPTETGNDDDKYDYDDSTDAYNDDGKDDDKDDTTTISDDTGSSTSDGGQTISDDAGSSTSDGGQTISDDAGSSTSDGGQTISDDAGSSTSDGGQISDDARSSTSDGGVADDAASGSSDGGDNTQGDRETDAGGFSSGVDGNVIRVSSLSSGSTGEVCTLLTAPNDYSNIYVGDFILHNNAWRTFRAAPGYNWEQCIYTNNNGALAGWSYDWGPGISGINGNPNPSGDYYVRSYPELIYGTKDEFRTSGPQSETGLPVMLSDMPTFRIDYSFDAPQYGEPRTVDASNNSRFPNGTTISGERNVAVESFFYEANAAGNCTTDIVSRTGGSNHTYEVMVWLDAGAERLPAGPNDFVANLNIRGADFKVYTKDSDNRYIAFVAQNPQTTGTIYMNDFIDWARENAHVVRERFGANSNSVQIQDDWCMANILVGTEIFWGAGEMNIYDWTITQSR